jgi:hypothetical protein
VEQAGGFVSGADGWFTRYFLLVALALCFVTGSFAAIVRSRKQQDTDHVVGVAINTMGSALSVLLSIQLLLPFVMRACWGIGDANIPSPLQCISLSAKCPPAISCEAFEIYRKAYFRAAVPATTGLGLATLGALIGSAVWFFSALKKVFRDPRPHIAPTGASDPASTKQ